MACNSIYIDKPILNSIYCVFLSQNVIINMTSVIEQCQVAPSPGSAAELTLPLTYFDHMWLAFHRMRRLLFYKLPISKPDFVQNIIPSLKDSLSLTLKHYTPLAGNVACPLNFSESPELRYVRGDSVSVTFSETNMDFNYLIGDHPRNAKDFYHFVPQLAEPKDTPGVKLAPLLAIQVTLFPNLGIAIGFTNHHVAGDEATIVGFVRAWALLNKFGGHEQFLANEFIPFYDRSVIKDPNELGKLTWGKWKKYKLEMCDIVTPPDKVREDAIGEETDDNVMEFFGCVGDCRVQFDPPLPQSYFGNCLVGYFARIRRANLVGKEGFTMSVELIREVIRKNMKDEEWILNGNWMKQYSTVDVNRCLSVAGSPKFDLYAADFGWGRPAKLEFVSIDSGSGISMSLSKSKDFDGDLEVGLSLSEARMNVFAAIFAHGLSFL
ncbi:phenolic glucoside malonyltransferase 1-like [Lycium ferocissimum]|uniref:phenolic glucoside malonyltransferase 1-like n=1 Tax=Lycium ferocissimum TaxID=112874 RepID=UPI002815DF0A|nr:phenolic glucoside malonyltransferase 1-like [Lycium ferocissimum]